MTKAVQKLNLHPRNKHRHGYDFNILIKAIPSLAKHIVLSPSGRQSINFANYKSVLALNAALLKSDYNIHNWKIPEGYLCPPIPGRVDYIHYIADLLARNNADQIPVGNKIHLLDIGSGASCIYPLLAFREYHWSIVGTEIDDIALENAAQIISQNALTKSISLIKQKDKNQIFHDIIGGEDYFDLAICNPPFYSNLNEAETASRRKWKNLGKTGKVNNLNNFGGKANELWYPGGELTFINKLINESTLCTHQVMWFSTLVSKQENIKHLTNQLNKHKVKSISVIEMSQGQKKSRVLAWTYLDEKQREAWSKFRWKS